jgi:hypothetical protein
MELSLGQRLSSLVLFGSRARGQGRDDSDLDLLVRVEQLTRADRGAICDLAFDIGVKHHLVIFPLVADTNTWIRGAPICS